MGRHKEATGKHRGQILKRQDRIKRYQVQKAHVQSEKFKGRGGNAKQRNLDSADCFWKKIKLLTDTTRETLASDNMNEQRNVIRLLDRAVPPL